MARMAPRLNETYFLGEFFICLSRACLGKIIVFTLKLLKK
eukprot:COSAG06_NODE_12_length_35417_cov_270.698992_32_plen_40_part_00